MLCFVACVLSVIVSRLYLPTLLEELEIRRELWREAQRTIPPGRWPPAFTKFRGLVQMIILARLFFPRMAKQAVESRKVCEAVVLLLSVCMSQGLLS